jgi:hypothetical protein
MYDRSKALPFTPQICVHLCNLWFNFPFPDAVVAVILIRR